MAPTVRDRTSFCSFDQNWHHSDDATGPRPGAEGQVRSPSLLLQRIPPPWWRCEIGSSRQRNKNLRLEKVEGKSSSVDRFVGGNQVRGEADCNLDRRRNLACSEVDRRDLDAEDKGFEADGLDNLGEKT